MQVSVSAPVVSKAFPAGTTDPGFTFIVTGTRDNGTSFSQNVTTTAESATFDLPAGVYTAVVVKLGEQSQPSTPFTVIAAGPVTISVPDSTQPAAITAV